MHRIIASAVIVLSLGANVTLAAAETVRALVPYSDLDLSTTEGMATLQRRVQTAAKRICGQADLRNIQDVSDRQRCLQETMDAAGRQIVQATGNYRVLALNGSSRR
jgi:UrcA family protein